MGTRITDPRAAHLTPMAMTDSDWPQLMRVNPLLHWTYSDVWNFLRSLSIPYCSLYDVGYTSIGSMEDTHPNPSLRYVTDSGLTEYHPAYILSDFHLERSGRRKPNPMPCEAKPESSVN
ncbi:Molybdopterin-binding protein [Fasciola gigantica]|uniref:FAD synthase n=1 Tax=Fasciola gigantica TaxID=46835 RepID=A0A504ZCC3_FASGI|nr:Molybdopterin-binding protein [Fasciola gigantica]